MADKFIFSISVVVLALSFVFGYNIAAVNSASSSFNSYYNAVTYEKYWSFIVAGFFPAGACIGSLFSSIFTHKFGPRGSMFYISLINVFACLFCWIAYIKHPDPEFKESTSKYQEKLLNYFNTTVYNATNNSTNDFEMWKKIDKNIGWSHIIAGIDFPIILYVFGLGRLLVGIFVGLASGIGPMYIMEISPKSKRGMIGVLNQLLITFGILVSQIIGLKQVLRHSWGAILCLPVFISILSLCLLLFVPESPRYLLIVKDNEEMAQKSLKSLRSDHIACKIEMAQMKEERDNMQKENHNIAFFKMFTIAGIKWQLITLIFMHICQALSGINAVFFYSDKIFKMCHIDDDKLAYYAILLGFLNFAMTLVSTAIIEKTGRKILLGYGYLTLGIFMIILTFALSNKSGTVSLIALLGYIAGFAIGPGPIPWMYNTELFEQNARSSASMIGTVTNWSFNYLVAAFFPVLQELISEDVFIIFIIVAFSAYAYIHLIVKETKNKSFTSIYNDFSKLNGVEKKCQYLDDDNETVLLK